MSLRKINLSLLGISGIVYRCYVVIVQTIVLRVVIGEWIFALHVSVGWNILSTILYYIYHYWFAKMFEMRKEKEEIL